MWKRIKSDIDHIIAGKVSLPVSSSQKYKSVGRYAVPPERIRDTRPVYIFGELRMLQDQARARNSPQNRGPAAYGRFNNLRQPAERAESDMTLRDGGQWTNIRQRTRTPETAEVGQVHHAFSKKRAVGLRNQDLTPK